MPELPEVESTRRHLLPVLDGAVIDAFDVRRPRMLRRQPRPRDAADRARGRRVVDVGRHGKFLMIGLEGDLTWIMHLGMSGRVSVAAVGDSEVAHTNVVVGLAGGAEVRLVDPRTFGFVSVLVPDELADDPVSRLGPDALTNLPPASGLVRAMRDRVVPIKPLLLDQRFLAGVGNIYADEILHRARIHPARPAGTLESGEVRRLRSAIVPVLEDGLAHGGTSLDDLAYLLPDGRAGEYLHLLRAYDREDEPCLRCGTPIERRVLRQRSTYFCPTCQPESP